MWLDLWASRFENMRSMIRGSKTFLAWSRERFSYFNNLTIYRIPVQFWTSLRFELCRRNAKRCWITPSARYSSPLFLRRWSAVGSSCFIFQKWFLPSAHLPIRHGPFFATLSYNNVHMTSWFNLDASLEIEQTSSPISFFQKMIGITNSASYYSMMAVASSKAARIAITKHD